MSPQVNITLSTGRAFAWQNAKLWQDANRRAAILAQFWAKVQRADAKACWVWTGHISRRGYGYFHFQSFRVRAHRFAWWATRDGNLPDGQEVCHSCDNPACVNPDHLYLGSHQDNHLDSVRKGRKRAWGLQKLNAEQVYQIRRWARSGFTHKDIAVHFGIAPNTISQIVHRKTWAHLPEVVTQEGIA